MEPFIIEKIHYTPTLRYLMSEEVIITGFEEGITQGIIPETVTHNGVTYAVTYIKTGSFRNCHSLQRISLPQHLKKVEERSFEHCKNLESVMFSGNKKIFQKNAFKDCPKLQDTQGLMIFDQIVIDYFGTHHHVNIPEGVTEISQYAFLKNTKLVSITFPSTLEKISFGAFSYCSKLQEVHLPTSLERLASRAFALCKGLKKVVLPEHFTLIEEETFARCSRLEEINFPENLTLIQEEAFIHCSSLTKIHFPKCLQIIEKRAFSHCNNLIELEFPETVQEIGTHGFKGCDGLERVRFHHKAEDKPNIKIPKNSFSYMPKGIHISDFVLKAWTPQEREKLRFRQLSQWDDLSQEEKEIFFKEWKSKKAKNPLKEMVFYQGTGKEVSTFFHQGFHLTLEELEDILADSIANGDTTKTAILLEYKNKHFTKNSIEEYETEKELIEIGLQSPSLKQFKKKWEAQVAADYLTVSGYKGRNKEELVPDAIDTGKPIKYVASAVFLAFWEENHYYNYSYSPLHKGYSLQIPKSYAPLERIFFPNGDEIFLTENLKESKIEEFHFTSDYRNIPDEFLYECQNIKKVVLPSSVRCICRDAFRDCGGLEEVVLSENLTTLQMSSFHGCKNLKSITFPEKLLEIDDYSFHHCHSLEEIILPDSLKRLGRSAFSHCNQLKKVILSKNIKKLDEDTFEECPMLGFIGYEDGENLIEEVLSGVFYR